MKKEPNFDVAQLAHVEIYSPKLEESVSFFKDLLGMEETTRVGKSVYLRAYEDFYHHTLIITEAAESGLGHVAWRASSEQALHRRVKAIEATGLGKGWSEDNVGHGPAYQFSTPDGHNMEILWEVDYFEVPENMKTPLLNRPQKRPTRGVPVRRLDHVNLLASDMKSNVDFMKEELGFRVREHIQAENGEDIASWLSVSPLVHEVAMMDDPLKGKGRLHHICYWYGYPQNITDIADVLIEHDIKIEAGPGKHGVSQAYFLYVIEPGGNRVELFGDPGYLIFDPDWKPITWAGKDLEKGIIWHGSNLPEEFFRYGTPAIEAKEPFTIK